MTTDRPSDAPTPAADESTRLTIGGFTPPSVPQNSVAAPTAESSKRLERLAQGTVRALIAAPAVLFPLLWIVVCLLVRVVAGTRRRMRGEAPEPLLSALVSGMAAHLGRHRRAGFVASLIGGLLIGVALAGIAVAVAAALPSAWWLATNGSDGLLTALRLGVLGWAVPLFSALLCWRLLSVGVPAADERPPFSGLEDGLKIAVSAAATVGIILILTLGPTRPWAPASSFYGLTSVLPAATRDALRDAEIDLVRDEAEAVLRCLADNGNDIGWQIDVVARQDDGAVLLQVGRGSLSSAGTTRRDNSVVALALHNQLPSAVATLVLLRHQSFEPLIIDRTDIGLRAPETNVKKLARAADVEDPVLPTSDRVISEALRCSTAHV